MDRIIEKPGTYQAPEGYAQSGPLGILVHPCRRALSGVKAAQKHRASGPE
jgi:hypothetical protein